MGKVSCDIRTGGERNLRIAVASNRYFTARDIKVYETLIDLGFSSIFSGGTVQTYGEKTRSAKGPV
jgi:hypothetical protein